MTPLEVIEQLKVAAADGAWLEYYRTPPKPDAQLGERGEPDGILSAGEILDAIRGLMVGFLASTDPVVKSERRSPQLAYIGRCAAKWLEILGPAAT